MNIFKKISKGTLEAKKMRTRITAVGVILFVAAITIIVFFAASLHNFIKQDIIAETGNWSVAVEDMSYKEARDIGGVTESGKDGFGQVHSIGYGQLPSSHNFEKPYVYVAAYDDNMESIGDVKLIRGRMAKNSKEVVVSDHLLDQSLTDFDIGDRIVVPLGNRIETSSGEELGQFDRYNPFKEIFVPTKTVEYKVVGICERTAVEPYLAPGFTLITKGQQAVSDLSYTYFSLDKYERYNQYITSERARGQKLHLNEDLLSITGKLGFSKFNFSLVSLVCLGIIIIFLGATLLLYNTFFTSVSEQKKQLSILSAFGATGSQLRYTIIYEGLFFVKMCVPTGIVLGLLGTEILLRFIDKFTNAYYSPYGTEMVMICPFSLLVLVVVLSLTLVAFSLIIPAIKVSRTKPIKSEGVLKVEKNININALKRQIIPKKFGIEGALAARNFARNHGQYMTATVSIILSIVLFLGISSFSYYLRTNIDREFLDIDRFDISYQGKSLEETEAAFVKLQNAENVKNSANYYVVDLINHFYLKNGQRSNMEVVVLDDDSMRKYLFDNSIDGTEFFDESRPKYIAVENLKVFDSKKGTFNKMNLYQYREKPNTIKGYVQGKMTELPIGGFVKNPPSGVYDTVNKPMVVISRTAAKGNLHITDTSSVFSIALFDSSDPKDSFDAMKLIARENQLNPNNLNNLDEKLSEVVGTLWLLKIFSYGFIILLTLIAIANVINTISTNLYAHRREFATYLTLGMDVSSLGKMLALETTYMAIRSLIIGIPMGLAVSAITYYITLSELGFRFVFPFGEILICIVGVILVVGLAILYTSRKFGAGKVEEMLKNNNF